MVCKPVTSCSAAHSPEIAAHIMYLACSRLSACRAIDSCYAISVLVMCGWGIVQVYSGICIGS